MMGHKEAILVILANMSHANQPNTFEDITLNQLNWGQRELNAS